MHACEAVGALEPPETREAAQPRLGAAARSSSTPEVSANDGPGQRRGDGADRAGPVSINTRRPRAPGGRVGRTRLAPLMPSSRPVEQPG